jgi:hypothetical protein
MTDFTGCPRPVALIQRGRHVRKRSSAGGGAAAVLIFNEASRA